MKVELRLGGLITVNGREVPVGQTRAMLDAVARDRSVSGAARRLGVSYRSAWDRLLVLEEAFGQALVEKTKGHGSMLTPLGEEIRLALQAPFRTIETRLGREQRRLESRLAGLLGLPPAPLRIAASHDPLLVEVLKERSDVELTVMGSEQAIGRLLAGSTDAAGCHFGPGDLGDLSIPAALRGPDYVLRPAFIREQGLIVAAGNPLKLRSVQDVMRTRARFINRQKGSGTRAWLDQLLVRAGVEAREIVGYDAEEFTHQAVGALIKSGVADVGLGVRAVAEALGLGFVPLGRETYFLAARSDLKPPKLDQIVAELQARAKARIGYLRPRPPKRQSTKRTVAQEGSGASR